jgi:tRNA threonylcarbamoyladenosine biosynthesis protein TsaB
MMMPMSDTLKTLALDTSSVCGSVALLEGSEVRAEIRTRSPLGHSATLLHSVEFLLERAGWRLGDLGLVAAGTGPGSFTGIRVGISTALGLSQSLAIPFAGVPGLDVLAWQAAWLGGEIGVVLDAQRDQVYYGAYTCPSGRPVRSGRPVLLDLPELERTLARRHAHVVADLDAARWEGIPREDGWPRRVPADLFLAAGVGRLALRRRRYWQTGDAPTAEPLYIRPPDAVRNQRR